MRFLTLIALLCVFALSHTLAQKKTESRVFHVSVIDEEGKPYSDLKPEHLSAWVDKEPVKIISVTPDNTPVSVGILIDFSGSIGPEAKREANEFRRKLSDGISHFLGVSHPENDYFAGVFNQRVALSESWTGPTESLFEKIEAPKNYGQTSLYDALYFGIQNMTNVRHSRRAILIITDGLDNNSKRTFKEVAQLIKRSDIIVYALALYDKPPRTSPLYTEGLDVLNDLTELSGGRAVYLPTDSKPDVVNSAFEIMANNLKGMYQLSVEKEKVAGPEKWRKLQLKLNLPDEKGKPKLWIRSRAGYYQ